MGTWSQGRHGDLSGARGRPRGPTQRNSSPPPSRLGRVRLRTRSTDRRFEVPLPLVPWRLTEGMPSSFHGISTPAIISALEAGDTVRGGEACSLPTATSGFGSHSTQPIPRRPSVAPRGTSLGGSGRCGRRAPRAGSLRRRAARPRLAPGDMVHLRGGDQGRAICSGSSRWLARSQPPVALHVADPEARVGRERAGAGCCRRSAGRSTSSRRPTNRGNRPQE